MQELGATEDVESWRRQEERATQKRKEREERAEQERVKRQRTSAGGGGGRGFEVSLFLAIFWQSFGIFWQWSIWAILLTSCFVYRLSATSRLKPRLRRT